jgi:hypothetical protein
VSTVAIFARRIENLFAVSGFVADASSRTAIARLGQFSIGTNAGLGVQAPKQTFIRVRDSWIVIGKNELSLPAQRWTEVSPIRVKSIVFRNFLLICAHHAAPPAAFRIARFRATRAS